MPDIVERLENIRRLRMWTQARLAQEAGVGTAPNSSRMRATMAPVSAFLAYPTIAAALRTWFTRAECEPIAAASYYR